MCKVPTHIHNKMNENRKLKIKLFHYFELDFKNIFFISTVCLWCVCMRMHACGSQRAGSANAFLLRHLIGPFASYKFLFVLHNSSLVFQSRGTRFLGSWMMSLTSRCPASTLLCIWSCLVFSHSASALSLFLGGICNSIWRSYKESLHGACLPHTGQTESTAIILIL